MSHDIPALETKVRALGEAVSKLGGAKHAELLSQIIHKPGWTTVRENELVHAHLDASHIKSVVFIRDLTR